MTTAPYPSRRATPVPSVRRGSRAPRFGEDYDKGVMLRSVVCLIVAGLLAAQTAPDPAATARNALDLMLGGKFQELNQMFTADGQKVYTVDALRRLDAQLKAGGAVNSIGQPAVTRPGPNFVVTIPVSFATQNINFTIAVTPEGKLALMIQRPGESAWNALRTSSPRLSTIAR